VLATAARGGCGTGVSLCRWCGQVLCARGCAVYGSVEVCSGAGACSSYSLSSHGVVWCGVVWCEAAVFAVGVTVHVASLCSSSKTLPRVPFSPTVSVQRARSHLWRVASHHHVGRMLALPRADGHGINPKQTAGVQATTSTLCIVVCAAVVVVVAVAVAAACPPPLACVSTATGWRVCRQRVPQVWFRAATHPEGSRRRRLLLMMYHTLPQHYAEPILAPRAFLQRRSTARHTTITTNIATTATTTTTATTR
jgi:hypothetical protein